MSKYDYYWWSPRGFSNEGVHVRVRPGHTGDERFLARLKYKAASDPDVLLTQLDHPVPSAIPIFGEKGEGFFNRGEYTADGEKAQYDDAGNFLGYEWLGPAD